MTRRTTKKNKCTSKTHTHRITNSLVVANSADLTPIQVSLMHMSVKSAFHKQVSGLPVIPSHPPCPNHLKYPPNSTPQPPAAPSYPPHSPTPPPNVPLPSPTPHNLLQHYPTSLPPPFTSPYPFPTPHNPLLQPPTPLEPSTPHNPLVTPTPRASVPCDGR